MLRSFSDRVFGGVCGGMAASLHANAWVVRGVWALLIVASLGVFLVPYLLLWWIIPFESFVIRRQRRVTVLLAIALLLLTAAVWVLRLQGQLVTPTGEDAFWWGAAAVLALVFCLRQFGGRPAPRSRRAEAQS